MDHITIIYIALTFGCLLLSAVLSAAETAIVAVSPAVIHQLSSEGNQRAKLVLKLREDKDKLISKTYAMLCAKYPENPHQAEYLQIVKEAIEERIKTKQVNQLQDKILYMAMNDEI